MRVLDLFSGLHGWAQPFWDRGHSVVTLDWNPEFGCDITADILDVTPDQLLAANGGEPYDIILASPPCERFSVAALSKNWVAVERCRVCGGWALFDAATRTFPTHEGIGDYDHAPVCGLSQNPVVHPRNDAAKVAMLVVEKTLYLIDALAPKAWVMENPRAMMRRLEAVQPHERRTVTYCQYGKTYMKPTDLWGNFPPSLVLREACKSGMTCHEAAPRGSRTGTQGLANSEERALIPYDLAMVVCMAAEDGFGPSVARPIQSTFFA